MKMRLLLTFAVLLGVMELAANANDWFTGRSQYNNAHPNGGIRGFGGQPLPVFQAAPWYLYWPYDAHFQTAAPMTGAYYGPPNLGAYPGMPYFSPYYNNPANIIQPSFRAPGGYGP